MIKEFHLEDAGKLADMFNASDEAWPGGFTHGMPVTPEMVLESRKKEKTISTLVAWDGDRIIGIVELGEFWRDTDVLYVGFLNVVPTHHGKGYGRDLLKACVQKSADLKSKRLDLHTWPGNMKAVPIYKKTGFFWIPKTLVYMRNFVPFILNMEVAKPYFRNHDWYKTFKREIKVEEDDYKGTFPYHWEEDGDMLSVIIDADSGGCIEVENNDFGMSQKVGDAFSGRPVQVTWHVKNKRETPLKINLVSKGEKGITIEKRESLTVEKELVITGEAFIDPDIEIRKKEHELPYLLTTEVVINGMPVSLVSGLRVKHALEVSTSPEYLFLPRGEHEILVILKNNEKKEVQGVITCQNTGESHPFSIGPEYTEAAPFSIEVVKDYDLQFFMEGSPFIHLIPVRLTEGAGVMQKGNDVILENSHCRLVVSLLGGETSIFDKRTKELRIMHASDSLGPPFWPSELFKAIYTVRTEHSPGKAAAEFTAESKKYNTRLTRRIEMDSSPIIKIQQNLIPQRDISLISDGEGPLYGYILTLPLKTGIISEPTIEENFPIGHGDIPRDPSDYKEQWMCCERDGSAFGLIWEKCTEVDMKEHVPLSIAMNTSELSPFYLYVGRGTWRDVRAAWSDIHGKEVTEEEPTGIWNLTPSEVMCVTDSIKEKLTLSTQRGNPMKGTVDGIPFEVKRGVPFTFEKDFTNLGMGLTTRVLTVETDLFEKKVPLSIVRVGKKGEITISEKETIEVFNELYRFEIDPHYYGAVVFFGKEVNHLLTPYPETTQLSWLRPWYGGIHPIIFEDEEKFPGRMHKELFSHGIVNVEKWGTPWKGVKVTSQLEELKGIKVEVSYLTTAFSNVLLVENSLVNLSSSPFSFYSGVFFFLNPEGSLKEATLYYYQKGLQERKRTPYGGYTRCRDWAAVKGGSTFLTVISDSLTVMDMEKNGAHIGAVKKVDIKPKSTVTSVSYLVAAHSLEESQNYTHLGRIP